MDTQREYIKKEVVKYFDTAELHQLARNGQWKKVKTTCKTIADMRATLELARDYEKNTRRLRIAVTTPSVKWWFTASEMEGYGIPQDGTPDFELIASLPSKLRRTSKIDPMVERTGTIAFWREKLLQRKISYSHLYRVEWAFNHALKEVQEIENSRAKRLAQKIEESRKTEEARKTEQIRNRLTQTTAERKAKIQRIKDSAESLKKDGIDVMSLSNVLQHEENALQHEENELARLTDKLYGDINFA